MSDPAVAALGDKQIDEVDVKAQQPIGTEDQSPEMVKDMVVNGTESKPAGESFELDSKSEEVETKVCKPLCIFL